MPDVNNLNDLFVRTLRRIYDAEQRLIKALPKLEKSASSPELKQAFQKHLKETETHVERLDRLFGLFDQKPNADTSESIKGLIKDGEDVAGLDAEEPVKDAGLIARRKRRSTSRSPRTAPSARGRRCSANLRCFTCSTGPSTK